MIQQQQVRVLIDEWLEGREYFLTDLQIESGDRIVVEIDHQDGVWIEDCVALSKHIEAGLDREEMDFELEVGSAGLGQAFKVERQYEIHVGRMVEVLTKASEKIVGLLAHYQPGLITLHTKQRVKLEGQKRPRMQEVALEIALEDIKWTKLHIDFK